jgi:hypothetical protein
LFYKAAQEVKNVSLKKQKGQPVDPAASPPVFASILRDALSEINSRAAIREAP